MLSILAKLLEKLLFRNVNIPIDMLLGTIDLFESSEGIMFCISNVLIGFRKKKLYVLVFRKTEKCFYERLIVYFAFQQLLRNNY